VPSQSKMTSFMGPGYSTTPRRIVPEIVSAARGSGASAWPPHLPLSMRAELRQNGLPAADCSSLV
jgi:hypothetical protein